MRKLIALVAFTYVFFVSPLVSGQPCPPVDVNLAVHDQAQVWWMVLLDFAVQLSAPLVTAILGLLGTFLVRKLTRKWDDEKQGAAVQLTQSMIQAGVAFAEEQARKALRTHQVPTKGAQKMQNALDFVRQQLDASGLPNVAEEELVRLIEARLQQERARPDGVVPSDPLVVPPPPPPMKPTA